MNLHRLYSFTGRYVSQQTIREHVRHAQTRDTTEESCMFLDCRAKSCHLFGARDRAMHHIGTLTHP